MPSAAVWAYISYHEMEVVLMGTLVVVGHTPDLLLPVDGAPGVHSSRF